MELVLIETSWNVKEYYISSEMYKRRPVLIETSWNVKAHSLLSK